MYAWHFVKTHDNVLPILCGDLNARTARNAPCDLDLDAARFDTFAGNVWVEDCVNSMSFQRCSQDLHVNTYGQHLLRLCSSFDMYILNGFSEGYETGRFTYILPTGNNVIIN